MDNILQVSYHRNGVSGDPFYAVLFETDSIGTLVACVPAKIFKDNGELRAAAKKQEPPCYVLKVDAVAQHNVTFGIASVRGDHFFGPVCEAIKAWVKDDRAFGLAETRADADRGDEPEPESIGAPSGERSRPSTLTVNARSQASQ